MVLRVAGGWNCARYAVTIRRAVGLMAATIVVGTSLMAGVGVADSPRAESQEEEAAAAGTITVEVVPAVVAVGPGQVAEVQVAVYNTGAAPASVRSLDLLAPAAVEVVAADRQPFTIAGGERVVRMFEVAAAPGSASGKLVAVADVSSPVGGSASTTDRFVSATAELSVTAPASDLKASIVSAPTDLFDGQRNRRLVVQLQNPTPYELREIQLQGINSTDITVGSGSTLEECLTPVNRSVGCIESLGRGASLLVALDLRVDGAVHTGKQTVGVMVSGEFAVPGAAQPTSASVTTEVDLSVFGVKVVSPYGASAVFFLPAIVAFVTFILAGRLVYPRTSWLPSKIEVADPTRLTLLLPLAGAAYLAIYGILGVDLTEEMSTWWVAVLFAVGFATGALAWLIYIWRYWERAGKKLFKASDSPAQVLKRLARNDSSLLRPQRISSGMPVVVLGRGAGDTIAISSLLVPIYTEGEGDPSSAFMALVNSGDPAAVLNSMGLRVKLQWAGSGVALVPASQPQETLAVPTPLIRER